MRFKVFFLTLFFLGATFAFSFQEVKNLSLPVEGIEKLEIDCGAGFLKVGGIENISTIEVEAEIVLRGVSEKKVEEFIKENIDLYLERRGSKAVLVSKIKHHFGFLSFREEKIDLAVKVPKNIDVSIDDGSGSMTIENLKGTVNIEDGSGSMTIKNITGRVDIVDGSGDILVEDVEGSLDVDDGSGQIDAIGISGDVSIDDNSGGMYLKNIGGNVTLSDGSGSINIDGVEKNVTIEDDGSGSVKIRNVKGKVIKQ